MRALAVFDDGSSPALYAGGRFDTAGGVWVNNVARWSGTTWSALSGPSGVGVSDSGNTVNALAVFNDGSGPALYAGGLFGRAGGLVAFNIARWDGSVWSVLAGIGVTGGGVNALTVLDDGSGPALYLGGAFDAAGGITVNRVARWDGSVWCPLSGPSGIGVSGDVRAFTLFDDGGGTALYAGGNFWHAGGVTVNNIARWDGSAWSALSGPSGTGVNGEGIRALAVFDDGTGVLLYAGGELDSAGGVTANEIAAWDGSGWIAVSGSPGTGVDGDVDALVVYDDGTGPALYVGGGFETAGGVVVNNVARWDGSGWSALSGASGTGTSGGGGVRALAAFDDGSGPALYVGGQFWEAGGVAVSGIARWDGNTWTALGSGMEGSNQRVLALAVYDDGTGAALYAGGEFDTAGGVTVNNVARWDGASWSGLSGPSATGVGSYNVSALAVFDDGSGPALYAGGWFETAGGVPVNHVARWNGSGWSDVGGGVGIVSPWDPAVRALAVFNNGAGPALCAGGYFDTAGDVTVNGIARWDGSAWSALVGPAGTGVDGLVAALTVSDDGSGPALFAGGTFDTAGGVTVNNVARWDGASWSGLSGPSATGVGSYGVSALAVFDDGSGPALYAGGGFETAGGLASNGIAAWRCFFEIFADGFESGDTSAWSATVP